MQRIEGDFKTSLFLRQLNSFYFDSCDRNRTVQPFGLTGPLNEAVLREWSQISPLRQVLCEPLSCQTRGLLELQFPRNWRRADSIQLPMNRVAVVFGTGTGLVGVSLTRDIVIGKGDDPCNDWGLAGARPSD